METKLAFDLPKPSGNGAQLETTAQGHLTGDGVSIKGVWHVQKGATVLA